MGKKTPRKNRIRKQSELIFDPKSLTPELSITKVQGSIKGIMKLIMCPKIMFHFYLLTICRSGFCCLKKERPAWRRKTMMTFPNKMIKLVPFPTRTWEVIWYYSHNKESTFSSPNWGNLMSISNNLRIGSLSCRYMVSR